MERYGLEPMGAVFRDMMAVSLLAAKHNLKPKDIFIIIMPFVK